MGNTVQRGVSKPAAKKKGARKEAIVAHGLRSVGVSDFDRRPEVGTIAYVGPSRVSGRSSAIAAGNTQRKKHKSTGRGQK